MTFLFYFVIGLISIYLLKRYLGFFISLFLKRYLRCESVKLRGCTLFSIQNAKFVFHNKFTVEIENLRLNTSFISHEHSKPISFTIDDVRLESQSTNIINKIKTKEKNDFKINFFDKLKSNKAKKFFHFLQYVNARINCINIVLLEAIPDCLLHVSFENLQFETYRDREGLQIEVSYKLIQTKLFVRNFQRSVCLIELSLAGLILMDINESNLTVQKFCFILNNPRISVFDHLFNYVASHKCQKTDLNNQDIQKFIEKIFIAKNLKLLPHIKIEIDSLTVQFIAVLNLNSMRTISIVILRSDIDFFNPNCQLSFCFNEIFINDHEASSNFKCVKFLTHATNLEFFDKLIKLNVNFNICQPFLLLHQRDLSCWVDYIRRLKISFANNFSKSKTTQFADDFLRDFTTLEIKQALQKQEAEKEINYETKKDQFLINNKVLKLKVLAFVQLEINEFEGQLKNTDGATIVFGIELATFVGNNQTEEFEFGVESLWFHKASNLQSDFKLDLSQHCWGTAIAVGGVLAQLSKLNKGVYQLLIQSDECQLEWEESIISYLVEFGKLLAPILKTNQDQQVENFKNDLKDSLSADLWSSIKFKETTDNKINSNKFLVKVSTKKFNLFLTARQSISLSFFIENWKIDLNFPEINLFTVFKNVYIGQCNINNNNISCEWWQELLKEHINCGGVEKMMLKLIKNEECQNLIIQCNSSVELIWSTSVYLILLEFIKNAKKNFIELKKIFSLLKNDSKSTLQLHINLICDYSVELGFKLPRNHLMRWIVPSLNFKKLPNHLLLTAPTMLIEMDSNIILNIENLSIQNLMSDVDANHGRQEFKHLSQKSNKIWCCTANTFELVFPYEYNFAAAFDEIINCVKWIKLVHGYKSKPFNENHSLPADIRILIKKFTLQMNDDPFEICLQNIYEVMMDEVFERERRRQMLEANIAQLTKEDPLFSKSKIDALYHSLIKKDSQIYIERIKKIQEQSERCLMLWKINDLELHAFADSIFNCKESVLNYIHKFNPESSLPSDSEFSTLWARAVKLDVNKSTIHFRDYPIPYLVMEDAHFWGTLVGAEQLTGDRSIRQQIIDTVEPWSRYVIDRNMCPLKFYYDLSCEIEELSSAYGPSWEPCLSMISLCWNYVNSPSKDSSDPLPFWDKARLLLHGQFSMLCKKLVTSLLASPDPYNHTEFIELLWKNFEFDWISGEFRIQTDLDAFIRTASKYDDNRFLHLPKFKCLIQLDWDCLGNQHDHHSIVLCAPNKLPDYSTNVKHDSYRAFRSNSVSLIMRFEVKQSLERLHSDQQCPQILLYANTFKCLEFMENTLTTVNRPIKKGTLFNNFTTKRVQLSNHFKIINLSATLPKFIISYWMSFSSFFGFRMISDSLHLTMTAILNISAVEKNDNIQRKARSKWNILHMSAYLENAQIHLFGNKRKPVCDKLNYADNPESFFVGLSRLNYIREGNFQKTSKISPRNVGQTDENVVHRLTVHDLKALWTMENRDICLVIAEGVQKAHVLRKILNNDALKMFKFTYENNSPEASINVNISSENQNLSKKTHTNSALNCSVSNTLENNDEMLWKLVDEAETKLVAYSEEIIEHPTDSLHGVALCATNDVRLTNWQNLLNSQLILNGCEKAGFILVTAARASVTQRFHYPIWRNAQLLLKRSWSSVLSGMQYFAPLVTNDNISNKIWWLSREIIEEKPLADLSVNDKVNNYFATGEAVGGVVANLVLLNCNGQSTSTNSFTELQLQRVASRCSCQLFFCYYSDTINMEKLEDNVLPLNMNQNERETWNRKCDEIDCFTLKHNMLEVSTNSEQYQIIIDIVNNLLLFVDPKKTQAEENRRRLWFKLAKKSQQFVKDKIVKMQSELREIVSIVRLLERQSYFLNKELANSSEDKNLQTSCTQLQNEIEEYKTRQNALIDELAMMISCFKEKEVEEVAQAYRLKILQQQQNSENDLENFDSQPLIARRFEVCFEDCIWRLTENDGQISLAEMQIRNFLYTRTARIDNSGDHLLEIGMVKVLNLLPNCKYKETLARLPIENGKETSSNKTPSIRIICRELPPVGGISIKEHFEINIVPMNAQITYRFFEKIMAFFFPGRNIDKEDLQNLDVVDDHQSQQKFSLAKRFRGAVNNSFRTGTSLSINSGSNNTINTAEYIAICDEIDKMKERAKKNNMFVYIIIPPVPFIVSYKGNKEKNIEDVDRFHFTFPLFEYHDKNWTWLDLALAIKQRCKRIILQLFTQKVLRKRIMGIDRVSFSNIETIDEEEKKRIVLGMKPLEEETKGKRKT